MCRPHVDHMSETYGLNMSKMYWGYMSHMFPQILPPFFHTNLEKWTGNVWNAWSTTENVYFYGIPLVTHMWKMHGWIL